MPPHPQTFGSGGLREGAGLFACKGGRYEGARVPYTPFGDPYPHRLATYGHRPTPPYWPPTPPHLLTGQRVGGTGHLWPKGCGFFFRTYPHYPFGVGGRAFRPASLKHFSQTNCPANPITEKSYQRGFSFIFGVWDSQVALSQRVMAGFWHSPHSPFFFFSRRKNKKKGGGKGEGGIIFFFLRA